MSKEEQKARLEKTLKPINLGNHKVLCISRDFLNCDPFLESVRWTIVSDFEKAKLRIKIANSTAEIKQISGYKTELSNNKITLELPLKKYTEITQEEIK